MTVEIGKRRDDMGKAFERPDAHRNVNQDHQQKGIDATTRKLPRAKEARAFFHGPRLSLPSPAP